MKRILIITLLSLISFAAAACIGVFFLFTYSAQGIITETYENLPMQDIQINIGKHQAQTDEHGMYEIQKIKVFEEKVLNLEPIEGYEPVEPITLGFYGRTAIRDIQLKPTLEEIVNRYQQIINAYQYFQEQILNSLLIYRL